LEERLSCDPIAFIIISGQFRKAAHLYEFAF
jgi:hypothetical protein